VGGILLIHTIGLIHMNTNVSIRYEILRYCSASWPPNEMAQKAGYWSLRVAVSNPTELKGVKTNGSAAGTDQRIIKVW
jgi:hypothetical protein